MLALQDQWIWDFWTLRVGESGDSDETCWHIWFLKADKALGDESLRHWNVTQGHAVSTDLVNWTHLGTCLSPAASPAWDDKTVWTGSVVRDDAGGWHQFYTGTGSAENGRRQRIGRATSVDGHHWQRVGDGLVLDLVAGDPVSALYEEYVLPDGGPWDGRAMRDPWVMRDPDGDGWLMYFTARVPDGDELNTRGAIGLARSPDLQNWTLCPPVFAGDFGQLEVPQVLEIGGRWYCFFCNAGEHWSQDYAARHLAASGQPPVWGTHYLMAEHPLGPWRVGPAPFLDGDVPCRRYAGRIVETDSGPALMAFNYWQTDGTFAGTVCDPMPLRVDADTGALSLCPSP
ncbi:hypothetical protein [Sphaerotilus sp.]|uniref:hypothetical protein n=1 Tax=Sphaerotilus sp. TaxID=2093942 RepID=UPI0025D96073|nr:hypothetical protein [Sphaerotilus sp.]